MNSVYSGYDYQTNSAYSKDYTKAYKNYSDSVYSKKLETVDSEEDVSKTSQSDGKKSVSGQTIGNPKLSEKAAAYYEELKKKYGNMNFILVSSDQKENAKANAASYASSSNMVVLIDEEKIEKMATDENYRKQYESIIANAASGLSELANSLTATGATVTGYGMQVNDNGTVSLFAALKNSSAAQKERIEKKAEEKKEAKKAEAKEAEKEKREERLEKQRGETAEIDTGDSDTVIVTASSIEELLQKISDQSQLFLSDVTQTPQELNVGQNVDFSA